MQIYERLTHDHDKHRDLAKRIRATSGDTEERRELWRAFREDVEAHANAEEQSFYAALIERQRGQEKAQHSIAEHKEIDDLFEEIDALDMSSPAWLTRFKQLAHDLEHHMDEEEEEVFPLARKLLGDSDGDLMVSRFEERKAVEMA